MRGATRPGRAVAPRSSREVQKLWLDILGRPDPTDPLAVSYAVHQTTVCSISEWLGPGTSLQVLNV